MRALALNLIVYLNLPFIVAYPFWGVLLWYWYGFMLPATFVWGTDVRLGLFIAIATLLGTLVHIREFAFPKGIQVYFLLALWFVYGLSTYFAVDRGPALLRFAGVSKMFLIAYICLGLCVSLKRLKQLIYTLSVSIGFLGLHGFFRFVLTGGDQLGGYGGNFSDNNDYALGLNIILPFLWYVREEIENKALKLFVKILFGTVVVAIIGTYSRGGFVTMMAVFFYLWIKSRKKIGSAAVAVLILIVAIQFIPQSYFDRIGTIKTYEKDDSAMSRILCMKTAFNMFKENPLIGVGLDNMLVVFYDYMPEDTLDLAKEPGVAHNTYLQISAEAGLPALLIYSFLLARSLLVLNRSRMITDNEVDKRLNLYKKIVQGGLVAASIGTVFLSRIQLELIYVLFAIVVVIENIELHNKPKQALLNAEKWA